MGAHMKECYDMQKFTIFLKPMNHEVTLAITLQNINA